MKRLIYLALLLTPLVGCAHLGRGEETSNERGELWSTAQNAFAAGQFALSEASFGELARRYGDSLEGRESHFYLGAIKLDPRNPDWDSAPAEEHFTDYLAPMLDGGPRLYRYPEALTLLEIARQLNLPSESRVAGLQAEERIVTVQERVVVPAQVSRELAAQVGELREQVTEREARIEELQEELERIRRTLTGTPLP